MCSPRRAWGGLLAAPLVNYVIVSADDNWRVGWILVAAACLIALMLSYLGVRDTPEEMGQTQDGIATADKSIAEQSGEPDMASVHYTAEEWSVKQALRTKSFWLIVIGANCLMLPYNLCIVHGVIHLKGLGISQDLAALSVGLIVALSIAGRLGAGVLANRIEPRYIWAAGLVFVAAAAMIVSNADTSLCVYTYTVLLGIGFGASWVCLSTIVGNYFGAQSFAPVLGIVYLTTALLASWSPAITGVVFDQTGTYAVSFYTVAAAATVGAVLLVLAIPPVLKKGDAPVVS